MTIEALRGEAETVMMEAVQTLRKTGSLHQTFHLMHADGKRTIVFCDGSVSNSEDAKRGLAAKLRRTIQEERVVAVIMCSDVYTGHLTGEAAEIKRTMGLTVEQAAAMGLCVKREAVMVSVESPIYQSVTNQFYVRKGTSITLQECVGTNSVDQPEGICDGRFMTFFQRNGAASA